MHAVQALHLYHRASHGIDTALVLSEVTCEEDLKHFAYHPRYVLSGVGDIPG